LELAKLLGLPVDVIERWPRNESGMMLKAWADAPDRQYRQPATRVHTKQVLG
jgi:hypothetical protein